MHNHSLLIYIDSLFQEKMLTIKGHQVLLDEDVANLFHVSISLLHRKIRENIARFPEQFIFKITPQELRKIAPLTLSGRRKIYAFTWGGIMMAAGQINTKRSIEIHLQVIRCYTKYISGGAFKIEGE